MDYNTTRERMVLPEYGRNIQKMVDYTLTVKDRDERNKLARAIVQIMGNIKQQYREISDYKHKLWDHLAMISGYKLDIDYPYELPEPEKFRQRPDPVPYTNNSIKYKHYGHIIEKLIKKAGDMEEGEEKNILIEVIANHMKKLYLTWNKDSVSDEVIFSDLEELSGGKIKMKDHKQLTDSREIMAKNRRRRTHKKK